MSALRYSPTRPLGKRALANQRARKETWPAVLARADRRCEMCRERKELFWAHIFGRPASGLQLPSEWANSEALTAALCLSCHDAADRRSRRTDADEYRVWQLCVSALSRLSGMGQLSLRIPDTEQKVRWEIREAVRQLQEKGVEP